MSGKIQLAGRMRGALRSLVPAALKITHPSNALPALERDGLRAECHRDWPDDPRFFERYRELFARNPAATVFASPAWQCAVIDEFVPAGQFRLITVSRGSELLAVVPLALNTASMLENPGRWLSDYLDPLVDSQAAPKCWTLILHLLNSLWDWSTGGVQLHHIRSDSVLRQLLPAIAPTFAFEYSEAFESCALFINLPKTWDEYLASIDSHERKEIKRKIRNAREKGNLQWLTLKSEGEMLPALERALAAMRQSESPKADFTDEVLVGFLRRLAPVLARQNDFYIQELWLEDKPAAWLLCLQSEKGPMIYNTSYDFTLRNWSPGIVSFSLAMQDAIAAGFPVFNLLRGAEEYKKRLGAHDLELRKIQLLPA